MMSVVRLGPEAVQLLICLFGAVPCGVHNIPLEVWLPRSYPREAPLVFVTPSPGIAIRPTPLIDAAGRLVGLGWHPEGGVAALLGALVPALAADPPFYPGAGRPAFAAVPPPYQSSLPPIVPPAAAAAAPAASLLEMRRIVKDKLRRRYRELQAQLAIESDRLLAENTRLAGGEARLAEGLQRLTEECARVQQEIAAIRQYTQTLTEAAEQAAAEGDQKIIYEDLVAPQGPIAQQIFDLLAEELAVQDTIYALSKLFNEGRAGINLATYLKQVRELAREQFLAKALHAKIRRKFPLING